MRATHRGDIENIYALSPAQQGMLFQTLPAAGRDLYLEQVALSLRGSLDVPRFKDAWQRTVARHDVLRTAFHFEDLDNVLQVVYHDAVPAWVEQDWSHLSPADRCRRIDEFLQADRRQPFELFRAPLVRFALLRLSADAYEFIWTHHHLVLDGWSVSLLLNEALSAYDNPADAGMPRLGRAPSYGAFIAWLQQHDRAASERFWRDRLERFTRPTRLPFAGETQMLPAEDAYAERETRLSRASTQELETWTRGRQLALNTVLQGAWALLLARYTDRSDVCYGATLSGRPPDLTSADAIAGLFVTTLPIEVSVSAEAAVVPWLRELQMQIAAMQEQQYVTPAQIHAWSRIPPDTPLFEALVVFENYPAGRALCATGVDVTDVRFAGGRTHYPLTILAVPGAELCLKIIHDRRRVSDETAAAILRDLETAMTELRLHADESLSSTAVWHARRAAAVDAGPRRVVSSSASAELRTPTEVAVAEVWSRVLNVDRVGPNDDFFELGGHSLLAMQVLSRIRERFQIELSVVNLFTVAFTVQDLAAMIDQTVAHNGMPLDAIESSAAGG